MLFQQHILIVINSLSLDDARLIKETISAYPEAQIKLSLLYVMPNLPAYYEQLPSMNTMRSTLLVEVEQHLNRIGQELNIPKTNYWIKVGETKTETQQLAKNLHVDAIISNVTPASCNDSSIVAPVLAKNLWREASRISCNKFNDYLAEISSFTNAIWA